MLLPDFNTQESQSHLMTARWTFMSCPYHLAKWIISRDDADDTCEILVEWNGRCLCETLCVLICFNLESWTKPAKNKLQSFDPNLLRWQERLQRSLANQGEECKGESLVQPLSNHWIFILLNTSSYVPTHEIQWVGCHHLPILHCTPTPMGEAWLAWALNKDLLPVLSLLLLSSWPTTCADLSKILCWIRKRWVLSLERLTQNTESKTNN
jgi:hypothetical protein